MSVPKLTNKIIRDHLKMLCEATIGSVEWSHGKKGLDYVTLVCRDGQRFTFSIGKGRLTFSGDNWLLR